MRRATIMIALRALVTVALLFPGVVANAETDGIDVNEVLRRAEIQRLALAELPRLALRETVFEYGDGRRVSLADFAGNYVLVNFWATWCAPCREEMPSLDRLAAAFDGERFEVVAIASGHNPLEDIARFYDQAQLNMLDIYRSPDSALAQDYAVLGLPTTVLLDPQGYEIARLIGGTDWFTYSVRNMVKDLLNAQEASSKARL